MDQRSASSSLRGIGNPLVKAFDTVHSQRFFAFLFGYVVFFAVFAWSQTTANFPFQVVANGTYDHMNLGDLSLGLDIPIRNKQGPIPFSVPARQRVYISPRNCVFGACKAVLEGQTFSVEYPFGEGYLGLAGLGGIRIFIPGGDDNLKCPNNSSLESYTYNSIGTTKNPGIATVSSSDGGVHNAPFAVTASINNCPGSQQSASFVTNDASGYTVVFSFQNPNQTPPTLNVLVYDKAGASLNGTVTTDRNGNTLNASPSSTTKSNCGFNQFPCTVTK